MGGPSGARPRRTRHINTAGCLDEDDEYEDGDLTTVETLEGLDVSLSAGLAR